MINYFTTKIKTLWPEQSTQDKWERKVAEETSAQQILAGEKVSSSKCRRYFIIEHKKRRNAIKSPTPIWMSSNSGWHAYLSCVLSDGWDFHILFVRV